MAESTRDRITRAARGLFVLRGYRNTTMDDIAREAGVSKRTVYESFASKDELAREVVESELEVFSVTLKGIINSGNQPLETLRLLSRFYLELPYPGISRTALIDLQRELPELWESIEDAERDILSELKIVIDSGKTAGAFRGDIDSDIFIAAMTGALQKAMSPEFLLNSSLSLEEVYSNLFEILTRGISANARDETVKRRVG